MPSIREEFRDASQVGVLQRGRSAGDTPEGEAAAVSATVASSFHAMFTRSVP